MRKPKHKIFHRIEDYIHFLVKNPFQALINFLLSILIYPGPFLVLGIFFIHISYTYGYEPAVGFNDRFWNSIGIAVSVLFTLVWTLFFLQQITTIRSYKAIELSSRAKPEDVEKYYKEVADTKSEKLKKKIGKKKLNESKNKINKFQKVKVQNNVQQGGDKQVEVPPIQTQPTQQVRHNIHNNQLNQNINPQQPNQQVRHNIHNNQLNQNINPQQPTQPTQQVRHNIHNNQLNQNINPQQPNQQVRHNIHNNQLNQNINPQNQHQQQSISNINNNQLNQNINPQQPNQQVMHNNQLNQNINPQQQTTPSIQNNPLKPVSES